VGPESAGTLAGIAADRANRSNGGIVAFRRKREFSTSSMQRAIKEPPSKTTPRIRFRVEKRGFPFSTIYVASSDPVPLPTFFAPWIDDAQGRRGVVHPGWNDT
jgi:hypothetical protein